MSRALALVALTHLRYMHSEHPFMLELASSPLMNRGFHGKNELLPAHDLDVLYHTGYSRTGGMLGRKIKDQLSVAHFAAGLRLHSMDCSRAHCASSVALRFSINVRVRSQSHRTSSSTKI